MHGANMKNSVGRFKEKTSNGANHWTLHVISKLDDHDMDKLAVLYTGWLRNATCPLHDLIGVQSTIPKARGGHRMVCSQSTL